MNASIRKYKVWVGNNEIFITYFCDKKYYRFYNIVVLFISNWIFQWSSKNSKNTYDRMNIGPVVVLAICGLLGKKLLGPCRVPNLLEYIAHVIFAFRWLHHVHSPFHKTGKIGVKLCRLYTLGLI